ncbi:MAG: hypothetical protein ACI9OJ_002945, partial [Myxococcota bacterium]
MKYRSLALAAGLVSSLLIIGCDAEGSDAPAQADEDAATADAQRQRTSTSQEPTFAKSSEYAVDHRSDPVAYTRFEFGVPIDTKAFEDIGASLFGAPAQALAASGTGAPLMIPITQGLWLEVGASPVTSEQVEIALVSAPVGSAYPEPFVLARVPASFEYGELFVDAATQALKTMASSSDADDFFVGWEAHSSNGGSLRLRVEGDAFIVSGNSPRLSLLSATLAVPPVDAIPWERLSARAPVALGYGSIRSLVLGALGGEDGLASGTCDSGDNDAVTAPHSWYQFCVRVDELITVQLGFRLADGSIRQLANGPTISEGSNLWALSADRLAANAAAGLARAGSQVTYYYSDPGFEGEALIHVTQRDGALKISHEQATPPRELIDTQFVVPPDPSFSTAGQELGQEDVCSAAGGKPASKGRFLLRFYAGESLSEFSSLDFPVSGYVFGAIFRADEVGLTGPIEGAEQLDQFEMDLSLSTEPGE